MKKSVALIVGLLSFLMIMAGCSSSRTSVHNDHVPANAHYYDVNDSHDEYERETEALEETQFEVITIEEAISELSIGEILADSYFAEYFWDNFDFHNYDTDTIVSYPELRKYCVENEEFDIDDLACIEMQLTPESSCFYEVGYSEIWERLVVVFRETGAMYMYYDVPWEEAWNFLDADSLGTYYNAYIKGRYDCDRIQ